MATKKKPSTTKKQVEVKTTTPVESRTPEQRKKLLLGILILALVVLGLYMLLRNVLIAATVNGKPISRLKIIQELEKQGGAKTLDSIVNQTIIFDEAKKQNITIPQSEIDTDLKRIEQSVTAQGQTLEVALAAQGLTLDALKDQIRVQKIVEKILAKDIQVSDAEIDAFIEQNAASIPEEANRDELRVQAKDQLKQEKLTTKFQTWIAEKKKQSKINYFIKY